MKKALLTTAIAGASMLTVSCGFKPDLMTDLRVEAGISMPLGSISLTDSTLFALAGDFASQLHVNPTDQVIFVNLSDSLSLIDQERFNSIFTFGEQYFDIEIDMSGSIILPPGGFPSGVLIPVPAGIEQSMSLDLPGGERLDEVIFGAGNVRLVMENQASSDYSQLLITIPEIVNIKTGQPLVIKAGQNFAITKDYKIKPKQSGGYTNAFTFKLSGSVPPVTKIKGRVIIMLNNLQDATGFFGRKEVRSPQITLSVSPEFEEFVDMVGKLYFADPKLVFDIRNQYEAPMIVKLDKLEMSGEVLQFKTGYDSFFVPSEGTAQFVLTNANTVNGKQLSQLIGTQFKNFVVDVNAVMNPSLDDISKLINPPPGYVVPTSNSFAMADSLFGSYSVTIPFNAVMEDARFEQELDLDLSSIVGGQVTVSQFAFGFSGTNSMPLDITINAYIKEGGRDIMIFDTPILIPASMSKNQFVAIPSVITGPQMLVTEVKKEMLDKLFKSKKLYFEFSASTKDAASGEPVKIFSPSSIDLNVLVGTVLDLQLTSKGQATKGNVVRLTN